VKITEKFVKTPNVQRVKSTVRSIFVFILRQVELENTKKQ